MPYHILSFDIALKRDQKQPLGHNKFICCSDIFW